jgi:2-polyprenyl-6-methoxyphenol hydroxylase-like FAD-dependent oxidoreductase
MKIVEALVPDEVCAKIPESYTNRYMKFEGGEEESLPAFNGVTGDIIFRMAHPGGRRVSRQELRKVLLDGVDVQWGKKLQDLKYEEDGVQLTFADGSTAETDFVVGADGASSMVRQLLVGAEEGKPQLSGMTFATGLIKYGDAAKVEAVTKLHPVAAIIFCPDSIGGCGGKSSHASSTALYARRC